MHHLDTTVATTIKLQGGISLRSIDMLLDSSALFGLSLLVLASLFLPLTSSAAAFLSVHYQHDRQVYFRISKNQVVSSKPAAFWWQQTPAPLSSRAIIHNSFTSPSCYWRRRPCSATRIELYQQDSPKELNDTSNSGGRRTAIFLVIRDYLDLIRPFTLLQAVGSLIVGCLIRQTTSSSSSSFFLLGIQLPSPLTLMSAIASVYLSYGAGMVANDCADASIDALHKHDTGDNTSNKSSRPIASGRVSTRAGCIYAATLSITSLVLSYCYIPTLAFTWWTCSNIAIMFAYAFLGLQKVLFVKNIVVGWLGVSPLIMGATATTSCKQSSLSIIISDESVSFLMEPLIRLAMIGFATGTAREILKDAQDVDIDTIGNKKTLPRLLGTAMAHKIAYGIIAISCIACWLPGYRAMFASPPFPVYTMSMALGTAMSVRASTLSLDNGQALFKKSIYVMLGGMIGGLVAKGYTW